MASAMLPTTTAGGMGEALEKNRKNTAYDGCGLRPYVLFFRPVPESELSAQSASPSRFCSKTQPPQRKKQKKNYPLHGCCPLLLEGGVRGGREKYGPNLFYLFGQALFAIATTPSYGHPSFPKEGTTRLNVFYVFARRRGDFGEMMDVRCEDRGACSPELTSSQTSRHAVPTASTGVFIVFFF